MSENIVINNFLGLNEVNIELHPITVIIGPQATGKSVIAKLAFFFREFPSHLIGFLEENCDKRGLDASIIARFKEYFNPQSWSSSDFYLKYTAGENWIEIKGVSGEKAGSHKLELHYSEWYTTEFRRLKSLFKRETERAANSPDNYRNRAHWRIQEALADGLVNNFPENYPYRQIFVPAGRAFFSNLQSGIFSFLSSNNAIDPFLKLFGSYYENLKRVAFSPRFSSSKRKHDGSKEMDIIIKDILCGEYSNEKGKDWLRVSNGRKIGLANASSGQQEALPLTLLLSVEAGRDSEYSRSLTIEEPEAHLFPKAQRKMVELIVATYGHAKGRAQFFITTHSPYVLTSLNNIIYASKLANSGDKAKQRRAASIMPEYLVIPDGIVHAYALSHSECKSIMNPEYGIIDSNAIDEVSNDLAIEFDKLISE